MRYYLLIIFLIALINRVSVAQESDSLSVDTTIAVVEAETQLPDSTKSDTTVVNLGPKKVQIIEEDGKTVVIVDEDKDSEDKTEDCESNFDWDFDWDSKKKNKTTKFKGHWAGFEFGLNNYVDDNFSLVRTSDTEFLDLNTGKSWNFNINFAQFSIPAIGNRFGFVTGMGLEWNNYHFSNSNTIYKNTVAGIIEPLPITGSIKKNRLQTMYLTIPLLMELQLLEGSRSDRLYFSGGVIAGLKMYAQTKYKISESGGKRTEKDYNDFYLTPFRYGITARAGYKLVKVYFNYYLTPLFIDTRGPELYPVAMGIALTF